jgi:hypothetical protein
MRQLVQYNFACCTASWHPIMLGLLPAVVRLPVSTRSSSRASLVGGPVSPEVLQQRCWQHRS